MAYKKLGLVFSGGGGRGAYQIGVWKALREIGLDRDVQAIAGTSIGALNAALFIQGDIEIAEDVWRSVERGHIFSGGHMLETRVEAADAETAHKEAAKRVSLRLSKFLRRVSRHGLFSRDGLNELIDAHLDLNAVSRSSVKSWVTCRRIDDATAPKRPRVQYLPLHGTEPERIRSYLLASSAIPFVYGPETIGDAAYTDGGIGIPSDVTPIKPVYDAGCDLIIAVYSDRWRSGNVDKYEGSRVLEVVPQEPLPILLGTFDFTPRGIRKRIRQGYADGLRVVRPLVEGRSPD